MIVLDTNVVSELMRARPDAGVLAWVDAQDTRTVALTAITLAELRVGVARLPRGRRRDAVGAAVERVVSSFGTRRVWDFDAAATVAYAQIVSTRRRSGRLIDTSDAQIAAICVTRDATLATRNGRDFESTGVDVVDPWTVRS